MVEGGLVEPARDVLFLVERFRVEPSGDLGLDLRTVRPAGVRLVAVGARCRVGRRIGAISAGTLKGDICQPPRPGGDFWARRATLVPQSSAANPR
jgi:hypothetical protein